MIEEVILPNKILQKIRKETIERISKSLDVKIEKFKSGLKISGEPYNLFKVRKVIFAILKNFDEDSACLLMDDDYILEIVNIRDFTKSRNRMRELKGRVIGEKGKAKKRIEELTNTKITICGKTINILGKYDNVFVAKKAVEMLLEGRKHSTVFKFLEEASLNV
ncbi:MAG: KH domain-containing protein [Candidatus Aenigmatarchaeota archaeon]